MKLLLAACLLAAPALARAEDRPLHDFMSVALSPDAQRIASIEGDVPPGGGAAGHPRPGDPQPRRQRRRHRAAGLRREIRVHPVRPRLDAGRQPSRLCAAHPRQPRPRHLPGRPGRKRARQAAELRRHPWQPALRPPTAPWRCWRPRARKRRPARWRPARPLWASWAPTCTSNASPRCRTARCASPPRPTCSSMSTTGGPAARASSAPPRPATATTTGGSPSCTRSAAPARRRCSTPPPTPACNWPIPASRRTGARVSFIGGIMSDFGSTGGDAFVLDLAGGQPANAAPANVTQGWRASVTSLAWSCDGQMLRAGLLAGGEHADREPLDQGTAGAAHDGVLRPAAAGGGRGGAGLRVLQGEPDRHDPPRLHDAARDRIGPDRRMAGRDARQRRAGGAGPGAEPVLAA